ncbi:MAG: T9SS type A sorting domain-containing protein [Bacteroidales bacterium]
MRKFLSLISVILISGLMFGQVNTNFSKKVSMQPQEPQTVKPKIISSQDEVNRIPKTVQLNEKNKSKVEMALKSEKAISGSFTLNTLAYIPGQTMVLEFTFTFSTADAEYVDGIKLTFPTGITPLSANTSPSIGDLNLQPIAGNEVIWGDVSTPSGYGDLEPGTFDFQVAVSVDASLTGTKQIQCLATGDEWFLSSPPHQIQQTLDISQALAHNVAVTSILLQNIYNTGTVIQPKAKISNLGLNDETIDITFKINDGTSDVYTSTVTGYTIISGDIDTITFTPDWTASTPGDFTATCTITTSDDDPTNNILTKTFMISDPIWGFAWNAYDPTSMGLNQGPVKVNMTTGEVIELGSYTSDDLIHGGDFVKGTWYASNRDSKTLIEIDTTTGIPTTVGSTTIEIYGLAYDDVTDKLYGTTTISSTSILYEVNYQNGSTTEIGNICSGSIMGLAADKNGNLYGINLTDDNLYSIDKATGAGTIIGPLGYDIKYAQDIAFERDNNILYGALCRDEDSPLSIINTTTGAANVLAFIDPELTALAFPYTYTLSDNDVAVTSINLPASSCDLPSDATITVTLKNLGVNDQSNIPISISINNGTAITETVAGPIASGATLDYTFTQTFDFSAPGTYNVKVYISLSGDVNPNNDTITGTVKSFTPASLPFTIDFEDSNLREQFTIIDVNNDGCTWSYIDNATYANSGTISLAYEYNTSNAANDYFFTNCIELSADESFNVSLWYRARSTSYPESFEVYLATAPDPSAIIGSPIISKTSINNTTYEEASVDATVSTDGIYYLAIKATSDANMYYLYIDDINIRKLLDNDVAVTEILLQDSYSTGATVQPKAKITNFGLNDATVDITFKINDGSTDVYTSNVAGHAIASGEVHTITFTPDWTAAAGHYTATCTITTSDDDPTNDILTKTFIVSDPIWGFAWNAYDPTSNVPEGPVKINLVTGDMISISTYTGTDFMPGADFINGDWYVSSYDGKSLLTIDTTTGNMTTIGNLGLAMNGLAYDVITDKLYGCASDGTNSILYEINYFNGTTTQIGTIFSGSMIGIAANSHGNLYGISISDDALYSIDKATGAGTLIGPLGYDISYAQDIAFDRDNDKLYGVLYAGEGLLAEIDTATGAVTVFNRVPNELTALAFPYTYTPDAIDDISNNIFNIYPNPANNLININSNTNMSQITLLNSLGQVMMNIEPNTDFYQINIENLPEGIYSIRILTDSGLSTKLIVILH